MPAALPDGEPAPADGSLPPAARERWCGAAGEPFGFYVHVPFCSTRCGYCDFNTYTAAELGPGVSRETFADQVVAEIRLAAGVLGDVYRPVGTVFFGGGTPTLLPSADLARVLRAVDEEFGLADGAEVTTEANPDSVSGESLARLRDAGFTRVSLGMQSAVPRVLATLDRTHRPGRVAQAVQEARAAGFDQVSLDLIYGTPGENERDWETSLAAAADLTPDHVSAYALVVEAGTRLAAQVRRGELSPPDDDELADRYVQAEEFLSGAGLRWYEVSNWARDEAAYCRHNLGYWRSADWWGAGPGAHSHVGGVRWWNVRHPAAYAGRLAAGLSPAQAREVLAPEQTRDEHVLLRIRLADGVRLDEAGQGAEPRARLLATAGLLDLVALEGGWLRLTLRGRLLADSVVRDLLT